MKERRFVMWIITDFGQFVLLKVRLALNSICTKDSSTYCLTFDARGLTCITYTIRYDTRCYLTCARKPTWVSLIYRSEPTTKKCKNRRKKTKSRKQICSEITVNSPGNKCSEYLRRRNEGLQWQGFAEKEGFKPGVKEWVCGHQIIVSMTVGR